jgi:hypothetical protein
MKKETNEAIGTFIGQTIIWVLCLLAIGFIAKIGYILIKFSWGLI